MTSERSTRVTLAQLLQLTRGEEVDCDTFAQYLPAWIEGRLEPEIEALLEHHREICPECAEERLALLRALEMLPESGTD